MVGEFWKGNVSVVKLHYFCAFTVLRGLQCRGMWTPCFSPARETDPSQYLQV